MFDRNFVQVLNIIWFRRNIARSLRVLVEEFTFARLNCTIAPIL